MSACNERTAFWTTCVRTVCLWSPHGDAKAVQTHSDPASLDTKQLLTPALGFEGWPSGFLFRACYKPRPVISKVTGTKRLTGKQVSSVVSHSVPSANGVGRSGLERCVHRTLADENVRQEGVSLRSLFSVLSVYCFRAFSPFFVLFLCSFFLRYLRIPICRKLCVCV